MPIIASRSLKDKELTMREEAQKALFWMKHLGDEFEYIGSSPLQEKFKMMLLMVYIDIFSQIWWEFVKDKSSDLRAQKERFPSWADEFIFCKENKYYAQDRAEFHLLNGEILYRIRNSLLHFGGLPNSTGLPIFISHDTRQEFCRKHSQVIGNRDILVLCPGVLFPAVASAISNTVVKISERSERDPYKREEDVLLEIYKRIQVESALPINHA